MQILLSAMDLTIILLGYQLVAMLDVSEEDLVRNRSC